MRWSFVGEIVDFLIGSSLITGSLLTVLRVVGFILALFIFGTKISNSKLSGTIMIILYLISGGICTKILIFIFELLKFYSWEAMERTLLFWLICVAPVLLVTTLFAVFAIAEKKKAKINDSK